MSDLMKMHRDLEPSPSAKGPVLVAGDPERIHMKQTDEQGGIKVRQNCPVLNKIYLVPQTNYRTLQPTG